MATPSALLGGVTTYAKPFGAVRPSRLGAKVVTAASRKVHQPATQQLITRSHGSLRELPLPSLTYTSLGAMLLFPATSFADDNYVPPSVPSDDLFVSITFTVIVGLLSVVTLGVSYLALKSWLDSRQETEDRESASKRPFRASATTGKVEEEEDIKVRAPKTKREKRGFSKVE